MNIKRLLSSASIPLITALLAFGGAILGTYLGARLDQSNWESRFNLEQRKAILEKRITLIEKVSFLLSKSSLMEALQANIQGTISLINIEIDCIKNGGSKDTCITKKDENLAERSGKERYAINSDLSSTLTLTSIYFGPKTRAALQAISKDPWSSSDQERLALLNAMVGELNYFEINL